MITFDRKDLIKVIKILSSIPSKNKAAEQVHIWTLDKGNILCFRRTNYFVDITVPIVATDITEPFDAALLLIDLDLIKRISGQIITLELNENGIVYSTPTESYKFPIFENFPYNFTEVTEPVTSIYAADLSKAMKRLVKIVPKQDYARPVLMGVKLCITKRHDVDITATDGRRCITQTLHPTTFVVETREAQGMKPQSFAIPFHKDFSGLDGPVDIYTSQDKSLLKLVDILGVTVVLRCIAEPFPSVAKFYMEDHEYSQVLIINRRALIQSLKQLLPLTSHLKKSARLLPNLITFMAKPQTLTLKAETFTEAEAIHTLPTTLVGGDALKFTVNGQYLLDAIELLQPDNVKILIPEEPMPIKIGTSPSDETCKHVIMRARLPEGLENGETNAE